MTEDELVEILKQNNLESCIEKLRENHMLDENLLSSITDEDCVSIGITLLGDRKKLISLFKEQKIESVNNTNSENSTVYNQPSSTTYREEKDIRHHVTVDTNPKGEHGVWWVVGVLLVVILVITIVCML